MRGQKQMQLQNPTDKNRLSGGKKHLHFGGAVQVSTRHQN
jgi:hypothetical protein